MASVEQLNVFVASPSDLAEERNIVATVLEELNRGVGRNSGLTLQLRSWEKDVPAAPIPPGRDAQHVVFHYTPVDQCDIFIGFLWVRFGTPTQKAGSGTEEEFDKALELWERLGTPHVMTYFCDRPVAPSRIDPKQLAKVKKFQQRIKPRVLSFEFRDNFETLLREQLTIVLHNWHKHRVTALLDRISYEAAKDVGAIAVRAGVDWVFDQIKERLDTEDDPTRRAMLCCALGQIESEQALHFLQQVAKDGDEHELVRREASNVLNRRQT